MQDFTKGYIAGTFERNKDKIVNSGSVSSTDGANGMNSTSSIRVPQLYLGLLVGLGRSSKVLDDLDSFGYAIRVGDSIFHCGVGTYRLAEKDNTHALLPRQDLAGYDVGSIYKIGLLGQSPVKIADGKCYYNLATDGEDIYFIDKNNFHVMYIPYGVNATGLTTPTDTGLLAYQIQIYDNKLYYAEYATCNIKCKDLAFGSTDTLVEHGKLHDTGTKNNTNPNPSVSYHENIYERVAYNLGQDGGVTAGGATVEKTLQGADYTLGGTTYTDGIERDYYRFMYPYHGLFVVHENNLYTIWHLPSTTYYWGSSSGTPFEIAYNNPIMLRRVIAMDINTKQIKSLVEVPNAGSTTDYHYEFLPDTTVYSANFRLTTNYFSYLDSNATNKYWGYELYEYGWLYQVEEFIPYIYCGGHGYFDDDAALTAKYYDENATNGYDGKEVLKVGGVYFHLTSNSVAGKNTIVNGKIVYVPGYTDYTIEFRT